MTPPDRFKGERRSAQHEGTPVSGWLTRQRFCPDWVAIGIDYHAGQLSLREMALRHRCAPSTIANKASREGWARRDRRYPAEASGRPTAGPQQQDAGVPPSGARRAET